MRALRLAWSLFLMVLKRRLAYRADLAIQAMDELLRGLLALVMLQVYLSATTDLAGWNRAEMLFILGFALVPLALFHCFCGNLYALSSRYLVEGEFDRVLLRPLPTFLQVCLDRIAVEDLSGAVLGCVLMGWAASQGALGDWGWHLVVLFPVAILSAFTIVLSVFMAFAASSFWFEDRVGMVPPVYNLMEFGRWPIVIYHWTVKLLVTLLIPFAFCAFFPASLFLAREGREGIMAIAALTPLVAILALILASSAWRAGIRRYNSTGN